MHIKKHKGDIGLAYIIAELTHQEINVSLPLSDHLKYDLIAEMGGITKRVQVRYTCLTRGTMMVKLKSVWSNQAGVHIIRRKKGDFDILAVYCPDTKSSYFVGDETFECGNAIALRVVDPKGKGSSLIRMANDFLDCKRFFVRNSG